MRAQTAAPPLPLILLIVLLVASLVLACDFFLLPRSLVAGIVVIQMGVLVALPLAILRIAGYSIRRFLPSAHLDAKALVVSLIATLGLAVLLAYLQAAGVQTMPLIHKLLHRLQPIMTVHGWNDFFAKLLLLGLITPICEELFFRGIIQAALWQRIGRFPSALLTAALFAMMHAITFEPHLYLLLGLLLAWIFARTGSIRTTIACHVVNNTWALANGVRGFRVPLPDAPPWIDLLLIGSAALALVAGLMWLGVASMTATGASPAERPPSR